MGVVGGWKRYAEGFKSTFFDIDLDVRVEGDRTSPRSEEVFLSPRDFRTVVVRPIPVIDLVGLLAPAAPVTTPMGSSFLDVIPPA